MFSMIASVPEETKNAIATTDNETILAAGSLSISKWFICIFESILLIASTVIIIYLIYSVAKKEDRTEDFGFGTKWYYILFYILLLLGLLVFSILMYIQGSLFAQSSNCENKEKAPTLFAAAIFSSIILILITIFWIGIPLIQKFRNRASSTTYEAYL